MAKNRIQKFINETFGSIRGRYFDGQAWLYAVDVCKCLEIGDAVQAASRLDDDEKYVLKSNPPTTYTIGRRRGNILVNEAGLYRLVFTSRMPKAREFQRWVFHEVLPALRREGQYQIVWQEARDKGKNTRRNLTDALAELYPYLVGRGEFHHEDSLLYNNYSKLVNKTVGIEAGMRDNLSVKTLFEIDQCENICAKTVAEGMASDKSGSEIFAACKEKLATWKSLTE